MFKSSFALIAAALISTSAMATSINTGDTTTSNANASASAVGHGGNATGGNAYAGNYNEIYNKATAQQAQLQGQAQGQKQTQANQQNMTYNESSDVHYSGKYTVKSAPGVFAPAAHATAPCRIAISGGVSVIGWGASLGTSVEDEGCNMRENARILNSLGAGDAALKLMCNDEKVAAVLSVCAKAPE